MKTHSVLMAMVALVGCAAQKAQTMVVLTPVETPELAIPADPWVTTADQVFCARCVMEGKTSTLHPGMATTTLMHCPGGYYGTDGRWVPKESCNTTLQHWSCSQGHQWTEVAQ